MSLKVPPPLGRTGGSRVKPKHGTPGALLYPQHHCLFPWWRTKQSTPSLFKSFIHIMLPFMPRLPVPIYCLKVVKLLVFTPHFIPCLQLLLLSICKKPTIVNINTYPLGLVVFACFFSSLFFRTREWFTFTTFTLKHKAPSEHPCERL